MLTAVCAGLLIAASAAGRVPLAAALLVVQVVLVIGWFRAAGLTTHGQAAGALVAFGGSIAADLSLLRSHDHGDVRALAGVLAGVAGLAFVVQLARRDGRSRLTQVLTATIATGALAIAGAVLLGVRGGRGGTGVVLVALVAAGAGVLAVQPKVPAWASLPAGLGVGIGVGVLVARHASLVGAGSGAAIAAVAAAVALAARVTAAGFPAVTPPAVTLPAATLPDAAPSAATSVVAVRSVIATLPILVVAPAVLVVARIMVG